MASFSDNLGALTNFNPYVQQLPIEAMVSVGQQKQQQYNEGVQKIQSHIDQIAGLDVVRDVDKQYLQSKLDTLGSNLKKVAAGDFSNFQLTNSVAGMASKIGKDSNIQNAVASTARYRKGLADMETARKEGKSSPSNEWDFQNQANQWLNDKDVKNGFNGSYSPYTNYKKNALEVIKALTKSEDIRDEAFLGVDEKGNPIIADATIRKKLAGIPPEQIQQALMATLSPADFKQMEIDGRYTYSNADPKRLVQTLGNSFNQKVSYYNEQKKVLETAKDSTTSNAVKKDLDNKIASLDKTIQSITKEHQGIVDQILSGNAEGVKAQMYTNDFIDNFSKAFSYTETSNTYVGKTPQEMAMWRADKEQDFLKFRLNLDFEKEKFATTTAQKAQELSLKKKEMEGYGALGQAVPQDLVKQYTADFVINQTEETLRAVKDADANFIKQQGKDEAWLEAQRSAWEKSPSAVDPKIRNHFENTTEQSRLANANLKMISDVQKEAENRFGTIDQYIPEDEQSIEAMGYTYSPKEIVNFIESARRFGINAPTNRKFFGDTETGFVDKAKMEAAKKEMSPKEFAFLQSLAGTSGIKRDKNFYEKVQSLNESVNEPYRKNLKNINDFITEKITDRVTTNQGATYGIPTANEAQKSTIGTALSSFIQKAESQNNSLPYSPNFDVKNAKLLSVDPSANYTMTLVESTEYEKPMYKISVNGKDGVSTEFMVTPEDKRTVFGDMFEPTPAVQAFRPYQRQIRKMGGYSTALSPGKSTYKNAYLNKTDFPSVRNFGVKGNIEQPSPGRYSIRLSAYDPVSETWYDDIPYPASTLITEEEVALFMAQLNDNAVYELITGNRPKAEDLERVEKASKKPL